MIVTVRSKLDKHLKSTRTRLSKWTSQAKYKDLINCLMSSNSSSIQPSPNWIWIKFNLNLSMLSIISRLTLIIYPQIISNSYLPIGWLGICDTWGFWRAQGYYRNWRPAMDDRRKRDSSFWDASSTRNPKGFTTLD